MTPGFLVTSAINTKFGMFSADQRLQQTIETIDSINARCGKPVIILIEMAGEPLSIDQKSKLQEKVSLLVDFSGDAQVREIYKNPNWDVVKSATELLCFRSTLDIIPKYSCFVDIDRFFKVSGRYTLNDDFNISDYDNPNWFDKIIFAKRKASQFPPEVTGHVNEQFMSRCWSFPKHDIIDMSSMFKAMIRCMEITVRNGGYIDIEHLLQLYVEPKKVLELNKIGVQGLLGPNAVLVSD